MLSLPTGNLINAQPISARNLTKEVAPDTPETPDTPEKKIITAEPTPKSQLFMTEGTEPIKLEQSPDDDEIFEKKMRPQRRCHKDITINVIRDQAEIKKWKDDIDELDALIENLPPAPRGRFGTVSDRMCRNQGTTFNKKRRKGPHILEQLKSACNIVRPKALWEIELGDHYTKD
jgi:hypothetical protein